MAAVYIGVFVVVVLVVCLVGLMWGPSQQERERLAEEDERARMRARGELDE